MGKITCYWHGRQSTLGQRGNREVCYVFLCWIVHRGAGKVLMFIVLAPNEKRHKKFLSNLLHSFHPSKISKYYHLKLPIYFLLIWKINKNMIENLWFVWNVERWIIEGYMPIMRVWPWCTFVFQFCLSEVLGISSWPRQVSPT